MLALNAKIRKTLGKKVKRMRKESVFPAVLYGSKTKSTNLEVDSKEFEKIFKEAGESSLISLDVEGKKTPVLIHQIQRDPLTYQFIHVDFYQPNLEKEIVAKVPLVFEGEAPGVKELGGTLVKNLSELDVKALPQHLPHEIGVDVTSLKTFEDKVLVKDLKLPEGVKVLKEIDVILAFVAMPEKVEEELTKPIEENVEAIEKVESKKKEEEVEAAEE